MPGAFLNQIVQGILLGGLYGLFAMGLSLSIGVMRFINMAHGDLIVFASFVLLLLVSALGLNPFIAMLLLLPLSFIVLFTLQRFLLQRVVGKSVLPVVLVTLAISIIIQNGLLEGFGADTRKIAGGALQTATITLGGGINIGVLPLLTMATAIAMVVVLDVILYHSSIGAKIRAVSDDVAAADMIGLSSARIYATAAGIIGITVVVAASFLGMRANFDPTSGPSQLIIAFEAVVLGGLGSLWGTLAGGILLGVAQSIGAQFDAAWQLLAGHLVFLLVLVLRPQGLFPKH